MPEDAFSLKEVILEIRRDVKDLSETLDTIDREGSIGTKSQLGDHETRIRGLERWRWAFPSVTIIAVAIAAANVLLSH